MAAGFNWKVSSGAAEFVRSNTIAEGAASNPRVCSLGGGVGAQSLRVRRSSAKKAEQLFEEVSSKGRPVSLKQ